jgi:hypothetical protein
MGSKGSVARCRGLLVCSLVPVLACSSSPTAPGEPVLLVGELTSAAANAHLISVDNTGIMTVSVLDLRAVLWDVTLTGAVGELTLGFAVGKPDETGECAVTGELLVREGESYLWSLQRGEPCVQLFDTGIIPQDGVMAYSVMLELPG